MTTAINTLGAEVIGVYDSDFNLVFPGANLMKATVQREAKLMEHPIEDGSTVVDHKVILPVDIELVVFIPGISYKDTYEQIKQAFLSGDLYTVQTRAATYLNMTIAAIPHEETTDQADIITMSLQLRETIIVETQYQALPPRKVADPRDTSTVERAEQAGESNRTVLKGGKERAKEKISIIFRS